MSKKLIFTLSFACLAIANNISYGENTHYGQQESQVKEFYQTRGTDIQIEPSGARDADVIVKGLDGNLVAVGEIKHKTEIERDIEKYWTDWNSERSFGGKTADFKLAGCYSDKVSLLSREEKGFVAVVDGQLRGYIEKKKILESGDLIFEELSEKHKASLLKALEFLKKEGRVAGYEIETNAKGMVFIRVRFNKLSFSGIHIPLAVQRVAVKLGLSKKATTDAATKNTNLSKNVTNIRKTSFLRRVAGASVVIGFITSGYSVTKEIYDSKMIGRPVHPSRMLVRAALGFCCAILGGFLFALPFLRVPLLGTAIGVVTGIIGSIIFAIVSEIIFEAIVPLQGIGWRIGDFIFGGFVGNIVGFIYGVVRGIKKFRGDQNSEEGCICTMCRLFETISSSVIKGIFFGGVLGSVLFLIIFW